MLRNLHPVQTRATQQHLNDVLYSVGFRMGATVNLDGDHVKDLGFMGKDEISNYWPLNSQINQLSLQWRQQRLYVKKQKSGQWHLEDRDFLALPGKYFGIIGYLADARPFSGNPTNAGSSNAWGTAQQVVYIPNGQQFTEH